MFSQKVKDIYDTLSTIESKKSSTSAYPIHKQLVFPDAKNKDIYHWLLEQFPMGENDHVLDVGCGVGFGTQLFAKATNGQVKGISLSDVEVGIAKEHASKNNLNNISFHVQSFDDPIQEKYDLILCVESIKHSEKLQWSLKNLLKNLKKTGKLIIIEDFYDDKHPNNKADELINDWSLSKLYTKEDYTNYLNDGGFAYHFKDLTPFTKKRTVAGLSGRYMMSKVLRFLPGYASFFEIMRGGLVLEMMYSKGQMTYEALIIKKNESNL